MSQTDDTMKCDDYRRALTEDPGFNDESGHPDSCASCQSYRDEILLLDDRLAAAMALSVPELRMPELADIEMDNVVPMRRRSMPKVAWYAIAATVALAAFIGLRTTGMGPSYGTLEEQVLAHIDHEPQALRVTTMPVSDDRLARVLPDDLATMNHDAGLITYAQNCPINGKTVPHLVIQGERGPVTILIMPDEKISSAKTLDGVNVRGVILPVGNGSIAIVGDREERLDRLQQNVLDSINWST